MAHQLVKNLNDVYSDFDEEIIVKTETQLENDFSIWFNSLYGKKSSCFSYELKNGQQIYYVLKLKLLNQTEERLKNYCYEHCTHNNTCNICAHNLKKIIQLFGPKGSILFEDNDFSTMSSEFRNLNPLLFDNIFIGIEILTKASICEETPFTFSHNKYNPLTDTFKTIECEKNDEFYHFNAWTRHNMLITNPQKILLENYVHQYFEIIRFFFEKIEKYSNVNNKNYFGFVMDHLIQSKRNKRNVAFNALLWVKKHSTIHMNYSNIVNAILDSPYSQCEDGTFVCTYFNALSSFFFQDLKKSFEIVSEIINMKKIKKNKNSFNYWKFCSSVLIGTTLGIIIWPFVFKFLARINSN
jgi:hypothetical protein